MSPSAGFPVRRPIPAFLGLLLLAACGGGGGDSVAPPPPPPPSAPVAMVVLSATAATLVPQQPTQLTATPKDASGNALAGRTVTWTSSASTVASVNAGLVTAVAPGSATITATSEGKSADAVITVQDGGLASVAGGTITAASGNVSVTLPAQALAAPVALTVAPLANPPGAAGLVGGTAYDFGPNGTQFAQPVTLKIKYDAAQVSPAADPTLFRLHLLNGGVWEAVPGSSVDVATRTVTGTTTHFSSYAVAQVTIPVASVALSPGSPFNLSAGSTQQLSATPRDAGGNALSNRLVTWNSSANLIATVSTSGLVTGLAPGTATITATSETKTAQVVVTVVPAAPPSFTQLTVGNGAQACGLTAAGEAWCWGRNSSGELGDGTFTQRTHPVRVAGGHVFTKLSAGGVHTCGLTAGGQAWCWGSNGQSALGDGGSATTNLPVQVSGGHSFVAISAGTFHTCALVSTGQAWCWGSNTYGQLGDGTQLGRKVPTAVFGGLQFSQLSSGYYHTCGLTLANSVYCWGDNGMADVTVPSSTGILGVGSGALVVTQPLPVTGGLQWAEVSTGLGFTCARNPSGNVSCWGVNFYGNLGDGTTVNRIVPVPVIGGVTLQSLELGAFHVCGRSMANAGWCWGRNIVGQLGDASNVQRVTPVAVSGGIVFTRLDLGASNSCGLNSAGAAWCWGYNGEGSLGDGTLTNRSAPVAVQP